MALRDLRASLVSSLSPAQHVAVASFRDTLRQAPASTQSVLLDVAVSQMGKAEQRSVSPDAFFVMVVRRAEDLARTVEREDVPTGRDGAVLAMLDDVSLAQNLHEVAGATPPGALWDRLDAALTMLRRDARFSGTVRLGLTQASSVAASFRPVPQSATVEMPTRRDGGRPVPSPAPRR